MPFDTVRVERVSPLAELATPRLSPRIHVAQASYLRAVPPHYHGNPLFHDRIQINLLTIDGGALLTPSTPQTTFRAFYEEIKRADPALYQQILIPSSAAKATSTQALTPIKQITQLRVAGSSLPGDEQLYGWDRLAEEAAQKGQDLQVFFQGNGLYFNRGSAFFTGEELLAFPDQFHAEILARDFSPQTRERLAIGESLLKRPLLFFVCEADGSTTHLLHQFYMEESYQQGMARLTEAFRRRGVRSAIAASPALVIPSPQNEPTHLSLAEILYQFHANDVRHYVYCPYEGAVLLSAELGRAQSLQPGRLAAAISDFPQYRLKIQLAETLNFVSPAELSQILDEKGYAQRYHFGSPGDGDPTSGAETLYINLLEGVYSHLVLFLTRSGRFGLLQTSGTRGNITGNDGPTLRQLSAILRDLNDQAPFERDPIVAAASGSQGNDVPAVVCKDRDGRPGLLYDLVPETRLDEKPFRRGIVTTPRVGIVVPRSGGTA